MRLASWEQGGICKFPSVVDKDLPMMTNGQNKRVLTACNLKTFINTVLTLCKQNGLSVTQRIKCISIVVHETSV